MVRVGEAVQGGVWAAKRKVFQGTDKVPFWSVGIQDAPAEHHWAGDTSNGLSHNPGSPPDVLKNGCFSCAS